MNVNNFVVRPKRRLVEQYAQRAAWQRVDAAARGQLANEVAGLPAELEAEDQEAKRFDLLLLRLQIGLLKADTEFARLREQVRGLAAVLEEKASIPVVKAHLELILQDLQTDEWWQDVTAAPARKVCEKSLRPLDQTDRQSRSANRSTRTSRTSSAAKKPSSFPASPRPISSNGSAPKSVRF